MRNVQKKILKRAKSMQRPAKKAEKPGPSKLRIGYLVGLAALIVARKRRRAKRPARALRNQQGVGPAHIKGVPRAEERGLKHPHEENGHAAGPLIGSIDPS
ncbi:MAG TPA: hypothetical protein VJ010_00065 [Actinomycetota bacterium]|nr:hypothetical protein [Actinomycetota bacterium]